MLPAMPKFNRSDSGATNAVVSGYSSVRSRIAPNSPNFVSVEHRLMLQNSMGMPVLSVHIFNVVCACSKKQMTRVTTRRIIAFVQYPKPYWNWAARKHPSYSVRPVHTPTNTEGTIAVRTPTVPRPASIGRAGRTEMIETPTHIWQNVGQKHIVDIHGPLLRAYDQGGSSAATLPTRLIYKP